MSSKNPIGIRLVSLLAAGLIAAACGSTVPQSQLTGGAAAAAGSSSGPLVLPSGLPSGAHVNSKGQIVSSSGKVIGSTPGGVSSVTGGSGAPGPVSSAGGNGAPGSSGGSVPSAAAGPGVTATTISLGMATETGVTAGNQALGGSAATSIDYHAAWKALVNDANAHGGINGLRIVPVFHTYDALSAQTADQQDQAACADWTQDHHVFAVFHIPPTEIVPACVQKSGGVLVSADIIRTISIPSTYRRYPSYFEPLSMDLNTVAINMVNGLHAQNYFSPNEKLGLVTFDMPSFKYARAHGFVPALSHYGLTLKDTAYLHFPQSYSEYGQLSNTEANAVLKFESEGIDHVMFSDLGGNAAFFFMQAAERQQYRPRYGLSSRSGNTALADLLGNNGNAAKNQLHGALSIGWDPLVDTHQPQDPFGATPNRVRCLGLMRKNGIAMTSRDAENRAQQVCDSLWWFMSVLALDKGPINRTSFLAAVDRIGQGYQPGITFMSEVTRSEHAGARAVANMSFVDSCTCFKYTTKPYIP